MNKLYKLSMVLFMMLGMLAGCSNKSEVLLLKENIPNVEFGTKISENIADYLDTEKIGKDALDDILKGGSVSIVENSLVEGTDYQAIGEYVVKITYGDEVKEVKVYVVDTTKPVFKEFRDTLETFIKEPLDLSSMCVAEDLSDVTVIIDETGVDYNKAGTYKATITLEDSFGNTDSREVTIKVVEIIVDIARESVSVEEGKSVSLQAQVKGSVEKPIYSSSDKAIATVDSNGKVTGKKAGTVTISAKVGEFKDECKVTVTKKKVEDTSNSNNNNNNDSKPSDSNTNDKDKTENTKPVQSNPKLNKTELTIKVDDAYSLSVTGNKGTVKWSSSNTDIASVNSSGRVFGWSPGTATIKAEVDGKQLTCKVTVEKVVKTASISSKTLEYINAERAKAGLNPLKNDSKLHEGVKTRAIEASEKYSHTRPDGSKWHTVITFFTSMLGENIAHAPSPKGAVESWMGSEAHRMALLDGDYTHAAVGVCGEYYVCILISY